MEGLQPDLTVVGGAEDATTRRVLAELRDRFGARVRHRFSLDTALYALPPEPLDALVAVVAAADEAGLEMASALGRIRHLPATLVVGEPMGEPWALEALTLGIQDCVPTGDLGEGRLAATVLRGIVRLRRTRGTVLQAEMQRSSLMRVLHRVAGAVDGRAPFRGGHQQHVAALARELAQGLGLGREQVEAVRIGGLIHDIGLLGCPVEILSRPGGLRPAEAALLHAHPERGHRMLEGTALPAEVTEAVRHHHERLDGSGYPDGLTGEAIGLSARIVAVADLVEAMLSRRPHRHARSLERTMEELRAGRGGRYDADVVDVCLELMGSQQLSLPAGYATD